MLFQSTRPMRGATPVLLGGLRDVEFQSTRPVRGATRRPAWIWKKSDFISIHAPHAGRDHWLTSFVLVPIDFNPRAPCGARHFLQIIGSYPRQFQSTRPMRGATLSIRLRFMSFLHFNPRAPCGARRRRVRFGPLAVAISIHAPHAGRDVNRLGFTEHHVISIHAPHAGRDDLAGGQLAAAATFQSTRPMRGATKPIVDVAPEDFTAIHAPHAGRDLG